MANNLNTNLDKAGSLLNNANSIFDQMTSAARGLLCLPSLLGSFISFSASLPGAVIGAVTGAVTSVIQSEIAYAGNLVAQAVNRELAIVNGIINKLDSLIQLATILTSKVRSTLDYIKGTENCAYSASQLAACILNTATNLKKQYRRPAQNVDAIQNKLLNAATNDTGIVNNYLTKQANAVSKAQLQVSIQNL